LIIRKITKFNTIGRPNSRLKCSKSAGEVTAFPQIPWLYLTGVLLRGGRGKRMGRGRGQDGGSRREGLPPRTAPGDVV